MQPFQPQEKYREMKKKIEEKLRIKIKEENQNGYFIADNSKIIIHKF